MCGVCRALAIEHDRVLGDVLEAMRLYDLGCGGDGYGVGGEDIDNALNCLKVRAEFHRAVAKLRWSLVTLARIVLQPASLFVFGATFWARLDCRVSTSTDNIEPCDIPTHTEHRDFQSEKYNL
jgi:hypothetical protein